MGEAALQQWRRGVLKEEAKNVDLTQSVLFRSIQDWAHRHSSEERAASKGRRVTIQGGQIVQGSQSRAQHAMCFFGICSQLLIGDQ